MKLLLASERGFCTGVRHAVDLVLEQAEKRNIPIYILHELVHNESVVRKLKKYGISIVDSPEGLPPQSLLIFSAHGLSSKAEAQARALPLEILDATCPLVKRVHQLAAAQDANGKIILLAGKKGHREVEGILGRIPSGKGILLDSVQTAEAFVPDPDTAYVLISQTTFLAEDFRRIRETLTSKIKNLDVINTICLATSRRQEQIRKLASRCRAVVVTGSSNSSNSRRLCEAAREQGAESFLLSGTDPIPDELYHIKGDIGLISGASASEEEVQEVLHKLLTLPGVEFAGEFTD